ncbi:MAG: 50S ribosomal protein L5 [Elusimicrobia bacterium HGW-Elusimicrobia-1]|jgi:large subunit ribosomal protein L5|nr:MAG: 50S ribosomal protein L5 [Elusimicrobia bacterium HGW-Elusimicrobia-1]
MKTDYTPNLKKDYVERISPAMMEKFGYKNFFEVPKLSKVVINIGVGEARDNIKAFDVALAELTLIAAQKPQTRRAKEAISNFKLRKGMPIGLKVTLRRDRMYEFLERLIKIAMPRIRDFKGIEPKSFDGQGNYNLGLNEQYLFPEINVEKSDHPRGMNITICTTASGDEEALELLKLFGVPFKKR